MKVLYFTKYSRRGASSRLRSYQFFPFLEKQGVIVEVSNLFPDSYLINLYNKNKLRNCFIILLSYTKRLLYLRKIKKYDFIIIEKELFPFLPPLIEFVFHKCKIKYIVDFDDAIFHNYDLNKSRFIRYILRRKINYVMKYSQVVLAGNDYLAKKAEISGAKKIVVFPTVVDLEKYSKINIKEPIDQNFIIGWIGSPSTFKYIKALFPVFEKLYHKYPFIRINIIGALSFFKESHFITYIPWSESSEVSEIKKFSIGIMPLLDSPWEKGKCSYKLIQYMSCCKPVIASPVGMNLSVIQKGFNGFFANKDEDWFNNIEFYITHKFLMNVHGDFGYNLVKENYNLNLNQERLLEVFNFVNNE